MTERLTRIIHISYGGPSRMMRMPNGRYITFEDDPRFGPTRTYPSGEPCKTQFPAKSPFWPLYEAWCVAGRPVDALNRCIIVEGK